MRLVMYRTDYVGPRLGVLQDNTVVDANFAHRAFLAATGSDCVSVPLADALVPSTTELYLQGGSRSRAALADCLEWVSTQRAAGNVMHGPWHEPIFFSLDEVSLSAPVMRPPKIICVGLNYRDHAEEQGAKIPRNPILFAKFTPSVIGNRDPVVHPANTEALDYEAELAVVIGRKGRNIPRAQANAHIAGFTCFNDVTARDIQLGDRQWLRGKMGDTHAPMGPWLATPDELGPVEGLHIGLTINDEVLQSSKLDQLIFGIEELISFISETITLEPGDVIATGTPGGVGFVRTPPRYLRPGDRVCVEIDGLGRLENDIVESSTN